MRDFIVFACLLCAHIAIVMASPNSRVMDWINACRIDNWTTECTQPSSRRLLPWCADEQSKDRVSALMRAMQTHHPRTARVVPASCFGTNVQVYYLPQHEEFMINPRIAHENGVETRWYECKGNRDPYPTRITVTYLNAYFREHTQTFHNMDALALACELF